MAKNDHVASQKIAMSCNYIVIQSIYQPSTISESYPVTQKKLHELDHTYFLESKCYEDKEGISM